MGVGGIERKLAGLLMHTSCLTSITSLLTAVLRLGHFLFLEKRLVRAGPGMLAAMPESCDVEWVDAKRVSSMRIKIGCMPSPAASLAITHNIE